jgi:hypothetical protein
MKKNPCITILITNALRRPGLAEKKAVSVLASHASLKTGPVATGLSVLCRYSSDAVLGELHQVMQRKEGSPRAMAGLRRGLASVGEWKDLYRAAMLETDKNKVPSLIAEAECAIVHRARELFNIAGDNIEEEENLDDALYALRALRSCLAVDAQAA